MKANFISSFVCSLCVCMAGCVSLETAKQTHNAREYMTEDLEDQIMWNLIRAKNGMPFSHYEVQQIQAVVTSKATPSGSIARNTTTASFPGTRQVTTSATGATSIVSTVGAATGAAESIVRPFGANFSYERDNAVTVVINPVLDDPSIYAAYVKFLNAPHDDSYQGTSTEQREQGKDESKLKTAQEETITVPSTSPQTGRPNVELKPGTNEPILENGKPIPLPPITQTTTTKTPSNPKPDLKLKRFGGAVTSVVESATPPIAGSYVRGTVRAWEGSYYYVPLGYRRQFSELWLALVARKPQEAAGGASASSIAQKTLRTIQQNNAIQQNLFTQ